MVFANGMARLGQTIIACPLVIFSNWKVKKQQQRSGSLLTTEYVLSLSAICNDSMGKSGLVYHELRRHETMGINYCKNSQIWKYYNR